MVEKISSYLRLKADPSREDSFSGIMRSKRMEFFSDFCGKLEKPLTILDLGGSDYHWRNTAFANNKDFYVTIINTEVQNMDNLRNACYIKRDVQYLKIFDAEEYDIVYSNSLLEHIPDKEKRKRLADDIMRIGKHFFIQTPNRNFPVEPHFLVPFFQFLPENTKVKMIMNHDLGWFAKANDETSARELAASISLLGRKELSELFPGAEIFEEKYLFMTKSFIAYK